MSEQAYWASAHRLSELSSEIEALRLQIQSAAASYVPETSGVSLPEPPAFVSPIVEPLLDPGWSRLLGLVRPSVESAYTHLRRLSETPLTAGQKALLRLSAAAIAQARDSLLSIELALEEGPASSPPSPLVPVLAQALAAWENAFRGRGVALERKFAQPLPNVVYDTKPLRVVLHHLLQNELEAVLRGGRLIVRGFSGLKGELRLEFSDDGPGFAKAWLEHCFEPFAAPRRGHAGLGLFLARRTLRRWGGDIKASNAATGGARLLLIFASPSASAARRRQ